MINLTWKVFRQTGNINAYLLFKTLKAQYDQKEISIQPDK